MDRREFMIGAAAAVATAAAPAARRTVTVTCVAVHEGATWFVCDDAPSTIRFVGGVVDLKPGQKLLA